MHTSLTVPATVVLALLSMTIVLALPMESRKGKQLKERGQDDLPYQHQHQEGGYGEYGGGSQPGQDSYAMLLNAPPSGQGASQAGTVYYPQHDANLAAIANLHFSGHGNHAGDDHAMNLPPPVRYVGYDSEYGYFTVPPAVLDSPSIDPGVSSFGVNTAQHSRPLPSEHANPTRPEAQHLQPMQIDQIYQAHPGQSSGELRTVRIPQERISEEEAIAAVGRLAAHMRLSLVEGKRQFLVKLCQDQNKEAMEIEMQKFRDQRVAKRVRKRELTMKKKAERQAQRPEYGNTSSQPLLPPHSHHYGDGQSLSDVSPSHLDSRYPQPPLPHYSIPQEYLSPSYNNEDQWEEQPIEQPSSSPADGEEKARRDVEEYASKLGKHDEDSSLAPTEVQLKALQRVYIKDGRGPMQRQLRGMREAKKVQLAKQKSKEEKRQREMAQYQWIEEQKQRERHMAERKREQDRMNFMRQMHEEREIQNTRWHAASTQPEHSSYGSGADAAIGSLEHGREAYQTYGTSTAQGYGPVGYGYDSFNVGQGSGSHHPPLQPLQTQRPTGGSSPEQQQPSTGLGPNSRSGWRGLSSFIRRDKHRQVR